MANITHRRGDTFEKLFDLDFDASQISSAWFTIRDGYATTETDDTSAVAQVTLAGGGITVTGARQLKMTISDSVTRGWQLDSYVFDVQARLITGKLFTLAAGQLRVMPEVTRSS